VRRPEGATLKNGVAEPAPPHVGDRAKMLSWDRFCKPAGPPRGRLLPFRRAHLSLPVEVPGLHSQQARSSHSASS